MALKIIAYGTMPNAFLNYFQMGKSTARQCVIRFANAISNCDELKQLFFLSDDALPMQKMCADSTKKNTELTA
jgi:hypothetical protein